jgi:hypothetical protein
LTVSLSNTSQIKRGWRQNEIPDMFDVLTSKRFGGTGPGATPDSQGTAPGEPT